MSPAAAKLVTEFQDEIEPKLRAGVGELGSLRDWAGKLVGAAVRITGLLHLAEHLHDGFRKPIVEEIMRQAIEIARYYIAHAAACFGAMAEGRHTELAGDAVTWMTKNENVRTARRFSRRDLHRGMQTKFNDASTVGAVLSLLDAHGCIRALPEPSPGSRGGRRPSPKYAINPVLFGKAVTEPLRWR
ncbi:DUF3987 domain-containing protein [Nonomuraea sp. C10]|uniref:DUF3987 domain-containing protein n=1 Tax=Nonomuraea sp. C10 TaxID=2600577 RepID=UPI00164FFB1F|nr:DUF3987 domain-containing protein [Nonomuraea sp. C10]